jgi:hypothetical protein
MLQKPAWTGSDGGGGDSYNRIVRGLQPRIRDRINAYILFDVPDECPHVLLVCLLSAGDRDQ